MTNDNKLKLDALFDPLDKAAALADVLVLASNSREHDLSPESLEVCLLEIFEQVHAVRLLVNEAQQGETAALQNVQTLPRKQDNENPALREQLLDAIIHLQRLRNAIGEDESSARSFYREHSLEGLISEHLRLLGEPDFKLDAV